jgi:hypothetical protein
MWDLWWTKWHWGRFSPRISVTPANSHSTGYSTLIIYHPGLVQWAKYWPMYQVDSVSPHSKKLKKKKLPTEKSRDSNMKNAVSLKITPLLFLSTYIRKGFRDK